MQFSKHLTAVLAGAIGALIITSAPALALKVWTAPEKVTIAQLNANFAEVANTGLTNSNLASNASIAQSKIADYQLFPKLWVSVQSVCSSSPCTMTDKQKVTSVTRSGTGVYVVNFSATLTASHLAIPSVHEADKICRTDTWATTSVTVTCRTVGSSPAASDTAFDLIVLDS